MINIIKISKAFNSQSLIASVAAVLLINAFYAADSFGATMYIYNTTGNSSQAKGQVTIDISADRPLNKSEIEQAILEKGDSTSSPQNLSLSIAKDTGIPTN